MADPTFSPYEQYWKILLANGELVIQVPPQFANRIKKALINRKYVYSQRTQIKFNPIKVIEEVALDAKGKPVIGKIQLVFKMHNVTVKDI